MEISLQRLHPFCIANQIFFDAPEQLDDKAHRFRAAQRPTPPRWDRSERGFWISLRPHTGLLPGQGWKIHTSATVSDSDRVCELVWDYCRPAADRI